MALAPPRLDPKAVASEVKAEVRQAVASELREAIAQAMAEARSLSTAPATAPRAERQARREAKRDHLPNGVPRATTASGHQSANASPEHLAKNPINLNTATAAQLQLLPGVGPALAARILAYRKEAKGFKTVDDLDNVSGIGQKKLEKLRPLVTVK